MILGIGSDLTDVRRIEKVIERHGDRFLDRASSPTTERARAERRANRAETYAKRFAAKEACAKALGTGFRRGVWWRDMGVVNLPSGRPTMQLTGGALQRLQAITPAGHEARIDLTITDECPLAQAFVVISAVPGATRCSTRRELGPAISDQTFRQRLGPSVRLRCAALQPLQGRRGRDVPWQGREADERDHQNKSGKKAAFAETIRVIIHALIIALVIRTFLFQPFNIPVRLDEGDAAGRRLPVRVEISYGYSHYSLPFSPPLFSGRILGVRSRSAATSWCSGCRRTTSTDYIKRVIGLPGDRIQMIDGVLHINGQPVKRERIEDFVETEDGRGDSASSAGGDAAERRELLHARSGRQRVLRQHPGLYGAARPLLHDGRQPRQLDRQPRAQPGRLRAVREHRRPREIIFFSVDEGERAWQFWRWPWSVRWSRLFTIVR